MYEALVGFRTQKAAQAAALFVSNEHPMDKLKLIKLLYLAEREFLSAHGEPMFYDELFSLKHGPICSSCLNAINGLIDTKIWSDYIRLEANKSVQAVSEVSRTELDALSDADIEVIQSVWEAFGFMSASEIRSWTHKHCAEYTEVESGRLPIHYRDIMKALGDDEDADEIEDRVRSTRLSESLLTA